jgi:hypothetical protein
MTTRSDREFLKVQLLEVQRLKNLTAGHPLMSQAFSVCEQELNEQVQAIPLGRKESRAVLFFSGEPVLGSIGIDAAFAGRVIEPFQKMVAADFAYRWHHHSKARGRVLGESNSRLMLTGLPRGSFGLELSAIPSDDLFTENELADSLSHVTRMVDASARSDEDFASELTETAPRVVQNLKSFLDVVSKANAGLRLESGDRRCEMTAAQALRAYERVAETTTTEEAVSVSGIFRGVLLGSWMFNFTTSSGEDIAGRISQDLTEEQVIEFDRTYLNQSCNATFQKTSVSFRNGRNRVSYQLTNVEPDSPRI